MKIFYKLPILLSFLFLSNLSTAQGWQALGEGLDDDIQSLDVFQGKLYIGGYFETADAMPANRMASWDDTTFSALGPGTNNRVTATAVYQDKLYVGGHFTAAGGMIFNYMAVWDGNAWSDAGWTNGTLILSMEVANDKLYVGSGLRLWEYDGNNWSQLGINHLVYTMEIYQGELYIGGSMATYNNIAKLDSTTNNWVIVGGGTDGPVQALEVYDGKLYAGGGFNIAGGVANHIAIWDGSSWSTIGSGMDNRIFNFLTHNEKLYACGQFTSADGIPANHIATWDGNAWSSLGAGMSSSVNDMAVYNNYLYAGGTFSQASGIPVNHIAKWDTPLGCSNGSNTTLSTCETSFTSPSGNYTWTSSGVYFDTLLNASGCDSIITFNLNFNNLDGSITESENTLTANAVSVEYQWLDCDYAFFEIPNATNQSFTPSATGNYAVEITQNGCVDTSACYNVLLSNVLEHSFDTALHIFPNPTTQTTTVDLGNTYEQITVEIINAVGQVVKREFFGTTAIINIEITGDSGLYFLNIKTANGQNAMMKVIKE